MTAGEMGQTTVVALILLFLIGALAAKALSQESDKKAEQEWLKELQELENSVPQVDEHEEVMGVGA